MIESNWEKMITSGINIKNRIDTWIYLHNLKKHIDPKLSPC